MSMDQYERLRELGRGSFGVALLVRERRSGRRGQHRVVKEIDLARIPPAAQREAQAEAAVLKSLSHVNVIAYYQTFVETAKLYIVMEFADAGDLSAEVKRRNAEKNFFNQDEALAIFAQCCFALQHIHAKYVLHRDLKSQNIFMTKAGVVKLGDFGIAKVLDHTGGQAMTMIGTPNYMPPEVCDNKPYGIKADVWSLGVVLYELLALEPPFQGSNLAALVIKIVTGEPKPLPDLYGEDVRDLVTLCLQKASEDRPSADDLLAQPALRHVDALLPPSVAEELCMATPNRFGSSLATKDVAAGGAADEMWHGMRTPRNGVGNAELRTPRSRDEDWSRGSSSGIGASPATDARGGFQRVRGISGGADMASPGCSPGGPQLPAPKRSGSRTPSLRSEQFPNGARRTPRGSDSPSPAGHVDAVDEFLLNRELAAKAKRRAEGDGIVPYRLDPDADSDPVGRSGIGSSATPSVADAADEYRRNRELAAQAKARCLGEMHGRPLHVDRLHVDDRSAPAGGAAGGTQASGSARSSRNARAEAKLAEEEQHRQALQQAAAQARLDRKAVQQRVMERERLNSADSNQALQPAPSAAVGAADAGALIALTEAAVAQLDGATAIRQRGAAAKEEQRRAHEAELEEARRATRLAQREARAKYLAGVGAISSPGDGGSGAAGGGGGAGAGPAGTGGGSNPTPGGGGQPQTPRGREPGPDANVPFVPGRGGEGGSLGSSAVERLQTPRGGKSLLGGRNAIALAGAGLVFAAPPSTTAPPSSSTAATPMGAPAAPQRKSVEPVAAAVGSAVLGATPLPAAIQGLGALGLDSTFTAAALTQTLKQPLDLAAQTRASLALQRSSTPDELIDEIARLCQSPGSTRGPSRGVGDCRPCSQISVLSDDALSDSWQAAQQLTQEVGASLEYSLTNDYSTLRSTGVQ